MTGKAGFRVQAPAERILVCNFYSTTLQIRLKICIYLNWYIIGFETSISYDVAFLKTAFYQGRDKYFFSV